MPIRLHVPSAAATLAALLAGVVPPARADLPETARAAMEADLGALPGDGLEIVLSFAACPEGNPGCADSLAAELQTLGFAFCVPDDPWVEPDPAPPPGTTIYGCANAVSASAALLQGGGRLGFQIDVGAFFLDATTRRAVSPACPGDPASGSVAGEGYLTAAVSIGGEADVLQVGPCTRLAPVPGTLFAEVQPLGFEVRGDACLTPAFADSSYRAGFLARLQNSLAEALATLLLDRMEPINETICAQTPAAPGSWGRVKSRYEGGD